jgi:hypothetical protein
MAFRAELSGENIQMYLGEKSLGEIPVKNKETDAKTQSIFLKVAESTVAVDMEKFKDRVLTRKSTGEFNAMLSPTAGVCLDVQICSAFMTEKAIFEALQNDDLEIFEGFVKELRDDPDLLNQVFFLAGTFGHEDVLTYLMMGDGESTVWDGTFEETLKEAVVAGQGGIFESLLLQGRELSNPTKESLMVEAIKNNRSEMIQMTQNVGLTFDSGALLGFLDLAVEQGDLRTTMVLVSSLKGQIPNNALYKAAEKAISLGKSSHLEALLSEESYLTQAQLESLTRLAEEKSSPEMVSFLTERRERPLTESVFALDVDAEMQGLQNVVVVSFDDLRENPKTYLDLVCEQGLRPIAPAENPATADTGGVSKAFISTLGVGLREKVLPLNAQQFPSVDEDNAGQLATMRSVGMFFALLYEKNATKNDKFLTGPVFNQDFYVLVKGVDAGLGREELCRSAMEMMEKADPELKQMADILLDRVPEEEKANLEAMMGMSMADLKEMAMEIVEGVVKAAESFLEGTTDALKEKLRTMEAHAFSKLLQGEEVTKERVLNAFKVADHRPPLEKHVQWLRERVERSDEQWLKQFTRAVTGSVVLPQDVDLILERRNPDVSSQHEGMDGFEFATCFNKLKLPFHDAVTQEEFNVLLDEQIQEETFNDL